MSTNILIIQKKLLQDPVALDKKFEELYSKYDKNHDGNIAFNEYQNFITDMLLSMGRTKVQAQLIYTYFERADKDNSGEIDFMELRNVLLKFSSIFTKDPPTEEDIEEIMANLDSHGKGVLDFNEFILLIKDILYAMLEANINAPSE